MKYNFLLIALFVFAACKGQTASKAPEEATNLYNTESDDPEMNAAIKTAQATFPQFEAAFKKGKYDDGTAGLKVAYNVESGTEHIWVSDIRLKDGRFSGVIDNAPVGITSIKMGDRVDVELKKISDWMFVDKGVLRGGYTIRVIRNRMPKEEREAFDAEFPYKIED